MKVCQKICKYCAAAISDFTKYYGLDLETDIG